MIWPFYDQMQDQLFEYRMLIESLVFSLEIIQICYIQIYRSVSKNIYETTQLNHHSASVINRRSHPPPGNIPFWNIFGRGAMTTGIAISTLGTIGLSIFKGLFILKLQEPKLYSLCSSPLIHNLWARDWKPG